MGSTEASTYEMPLAASVVLSNMAEGRGAGKGPVAATTAAWEGREVEEGSVNQLKGRMVKKDCLVVCIMYYNDKM